MHHLPNSFLHTSLSAPWTTQAPHQRKTRKKSSYSGEQQREWACLDFTFPCTSLSWGHIQISQEPLLFNDCMAAGPAEMAKPCLYVHLCHSQKSFAFQMKELSLLGFPVAWNRKAALWPGLSFKNISYTTTNYYEAHKQVIQTSKIVKERVSCCFSSAEIKSCYSGFIPVTFEANFSFRFPNLFIELRAEFLFPEFHINMTTVKQTRIVYLKAGKHFTDERQTL